MGTKQTSFAQIVTYFQEDKTHPSIANKAGGWRNGVDGIVNAWLSGNIFLQRRQTVPTAASMFEVTPSHLRKFLKKTSRLAAATTKRRSPNMLGQMSWLRLSWLANFYKGTCPVEFTCAPSLLLSPLLVASCPTSTSKLDSKCWEKRWGVALFSRSSPSSPAGAKCQNSAGAKCAGAGA